MDEIRWAEIRRLFHLDRLSRRAIARHLGISQDTVARAVRSDRCPRRENGARGSIIDPYQDVLDAILARFPDLSGVRVLEKLRENGYRGQITVVRERLRELRSPRVREAFIKRETLPGVEAQADWGSCGQIAVDGVIRPLSVFVICLSYSRLLYVEFTVSQEMEDFLRCHVNAFSYFGGCPKVVLYDNLKSVVQWRHRRLTRFNARFMEFAGAYLFEPRPCNPRRGNEKPRAETGVRYVKQNFLAGREFRDLQDVRLKAFHWLRDVANVRVHGTTRERPVDRFEGEKGLLQALPRTPYDTRICRSVCVNHQARVSFQTNTYTVPPRLVGRTLTLKAGPDRVTVFDGDVEVVWHVRAYGRYKDIEDPAHTRAILKFKGRGRFDKERDAFLALGPQAHAFLESLLKSGRGSPDHHIGKLMHLVSEYGVTHVLAAMDRASTFGAFDADSVQNILYQRLGREGERTRPDPISLTTRPDLADHSVETPDLGDYGHLSDMEDDDDDTRNNDDER